MPASTPAPAPNLQLDDLRLILGLAKHASLSAAARALHVTPPALSMRLKKLEAQLGVMLALRGSRNLSLTLEGELLAAQAQEILQRIEAIPGTLQRQGQDLSGLLCISAPFGFGRKHIAPALVAFAKSHPRIRLTLDLLEVPWPDRQLSDVVIHIGEVRDSSWVAHVLARNERWLCASPGYVRHHGAPSHPQELAQHAAVCLRENNEDETLWHCEPLTHKGSKKTSERFSVRVQSALVSNDGEVVRSWAQAGLGIALRSQWDVQPLIAQGKLVRLLSDWKFGSADILALVPSRRNSTARMQALIAHLQESCKPLSLG
jgi:DNA-binding transcriptional LysR family regulator